jgi:uncharacterized protein YndB with AHSA1/START domain
MLKVIALAIALVVVGVLLAAARKPDTFAISRAARIAAPPDAIFPYINDPQRFMTWSPFERKDPDMKRAFSGAPAGPGSIYDFDGDSNVGKGRLSIVDAEPPSRVVMQLDMLKPIEGHNAIEFTLQPEGGETLVTWSMSGEMPFISKVMSVFIDMDRMIGNDFETGLASLKARVEGGRPR